MLLTDVMIMLKNKGLLLINFLLRKNLKAYKTS